MFAVVAVDANDLPLPVGADSRRDEGVIVHNLTDLPDGEYPGVKGDEGAGPGIKRPIAECSTCSSSSLAITQTYAWTGG